MFAVAVAFLHQIIVPTRVVFMAVNPQTYPENADYNVALASISKAAAVREWFRCVTYTDS